MVPVSDNYFACLNAAVFSDGSFVYRPKGKRKGRDRFEYRVEDEFGNVIIGSGLVKIKINKNKHLKKKHKHKHRRNRK